MSPTPHHALTLALLAAACTRPDRTPAPPTLSAATPAPSSLPAPAPAPSSLPAPAPHDLATDLAARLHDARARFTPTPRTRIAGDAFVLVEVGPTGPLFDSTAAQVDRAAHALFLQAFPKRLDAGVTILLFASRDAFDAYRGEHYGMAARPSDYGSYQTESREIAADVSKGPDYIPTVTHEMVHPLMHQDFPGAPLWFGESVASLFEAPVYASDGSIHGVPRSRRHARLLAALASPKERPHVTLDALFAMSPEAFVAVAFDDASQPRVDLHAQTLHYAMARAFAAWLDSQGKLWPFYRAWRDGIATDPKGEAALQKVTGRTFADANATWLLWVR